MLNQTFTTCSDCDHSSLSFSNYWMTSMVSWHLDDTKFFSDITHSPRKCGIFHCKCLFILALTSVRQNISMSILTNAQLLLSWLFIHVTGFSCLYCFGKMNRFSKSSGLSRRVHSSFTPKINNIIMHSCYP